MDTPHCMQAGASARCLHCAHGRLTPRFDTDGMPEGPSLVILREEAAAFVGRKILRVQGNSKQDIARLQQQSAGAAQLGQASVDRMRAVQRAHPLPAVRQLPHQRRQTNAVPRLRLEFSKGETLNFYACSVQFIERPLDEVYGWSADVMNPLWDAAQARLKLRAARSCWPPMRCWTRAFFRRGQHHQERSAAPHPRASGKPGRRLAGAQAGRTGHAGARLQL